MRKFKLILALVILGFIVLFVAQNEPYFKATNSFRLKIPMLDEYQSPLVTNWQVGLGAFIAGGVLIFLASLPGRMKTRKTLKELNATLQTHQDKISTLKSEAQAVSAIAESPASQDPLPNHKTSGDEIFADEVSGAKTASSA
jgi:hypothetical protein